MDNYCCNAKSACICQITHYIILIGQTVSSNAQNTFKSYSLIYPIKFIQIMKFLLNYIGCIFPY